MPIIHIYAKNNKSPGIKRKLVKEITDSFVRHTNVEKDKVQILWHPLDEENYARGGVLLCDRKKSKKKA